MKKISFLILTILATFLLISCDNTDKYKVTFYVDNELYKTAEVNKDEVVLEFVNPSKDGHTFDKWVYQDGLKYEFSDKIIKNSNIYAVFSKNSVTSADTLDMYYINDTHGAILSKDDELGVSKIANLIKTKQKEKETLFIAGGDMFQGQLISNQNKGSLMIEALNEIKLDAFVIGNHEFDWGLEEIAKYFDKSNNKVKANFPILGANVRKKSDNKMPDFLDEYTIVEKNGIKIGIIGVMGDGLETSIAQLRIKDYYFSSAYDAVFSVSEKIVDKVDMIVVGIHGSSVEFNRKVSNLDKVAAIFNAHTHQDEVGLVNGIPTIQSESNGRKVGYIEVKYDLDSITSRFEFLSYGNLTDSNESLLKAKDSEVEKIVNSYYENLKQLYENVILTSKKEYSTGELANYISRVMKEVSGADLGIQNSGGTRATISDGQKITSADIFQIFPFDNQILLVEVSGNTLLKIYQNNSLYKYGINESEIISSKRYMLAVNDYTFYKYSEFIEYVNNDVKIVGDMYETVNQIMINLKNAGRTGFDINDEILFD